jgi:hypothetical protein
MCKKSTKEKKRKEKEIVNNQKNDSRHQLTLKAPQDAVFFRASFFAFGSAAAGTFLVSASLCATETFFPDDYVPLRFGKHFRYSNIPLLQLILQIKPFVILYGPACRRERLSLLDSYQRTFYH